jgi:site-specific recombinase XerC
MPIPGTTLTLMQQYVTLSHQIESAASAFQAAQGARLSARQAVQDQLKPLGPARVVKGGKMYVLYPDGIVEESDIEVLP